MSYQPQHQTNWGNWQQIGTALSYQDQHVAEDIAQEYAQRHRTHTRVIGPEGEQVIAFNFQNVMDAPEAPAIERKGVFNTAVMDIETIIWRLTDAQLDYIADAKDNGSRRYRIKCALLEAFNIS
jgi:hypothetical protein